MTHSTDVFLTHNWGKDELNRNNHYRVSLINKELKKLGYKTWFDDDRMTGKISEQMCKGIERTQGMIVFVTQRYHDKVNGENPNDNCKLEFSYAARRITDTKMVAVVMEESMLCTHSWTGLVGMHLGGKMFIDMTGDIRNKKYLSDKMKDLQKELEAMGIQPMKEKIPKATTEGTNTSRSLLPGTYLFYF